MALDLNIDFNELDFENLGTWPLPVKAACIAIICFFIIVLSFWFDTRTQLAELREAEHNEFELKQQFEYKQHQTANLHAYKDQLAAMRKAFGDMLDQLPSRSEVPELLEDISKLGVASGLEFKLFDPLQEKQHDFYSELPIHMKIVGTYHQFGAFISRIAALDRIVTLHDFQVTHLPGSNGSLPNKPTEVLLMDLTAKTYRYTEIFEDPVNQTTPE